MTFFICQKRICDCLTQNYQNSLNSFFLNSLNFIKLHTVCVFTLYKIALTLAMTCKNGANSPVSKRLCLLSLIISFLQCIFIKLQGNSMII